MGAKRCWLNHITFIGGVILVYSYKPLLLTGSGIPEGMSSPLGACTALKAMAGGPFLGSITAQC